MDISYLKAPYPAVPTLQTTRDKRVHGMLRDLDKIKNSSQKKQGKRCEHLIYHIASTLRKSPDDHLLQTTAVWVLISIFRMFPEQTKEMMVSAGIPGRLFEVIKCGTLTGSSRQYASELCFYLSSNHPYPADAWQSGEPMKSLPEVQVANRYRPDLDDVSVVSDVSTLVQDKPGRLPFVPYRIDETNMAKMDAMFEHGYHHQLAASLPNHQLLSKYGFTARPKQIGDSDSDSDNDTHGSDNDDMDEESVTSTLSSASRSVSLGWQNSLPSTSRRRTSGPGLGQSVFAPLSSARSQTNTLGDDDSSQASSLFTGRSRDPQQSARGAALATARPVTSSAMPNTPFGLGRNRRDSESVVKPIVSRHPLQDWFDQHREAAGQHPNQPHSSRSLTSSVDSRRAATSHHHHHHSSRRHHAEGGDDDEGSVGGGHRAMSSGTPSRVVKQLRHQHRHGSAPVQSSDHSVSGMFNDWVAPYRVGTQHKQAQNGPTLSKSFFDPNEGTSSGGGESADIDAYFSALDPLALSVKSTIKSTLKGETNVMADEEEEGDDGWISSGDENDEFVRGGELDRDHMDDDEDMQDIANEFILKKRLRMRAEKLIDHSFVQKLFVKGTNMTDAQDLIRRMENLLELLDPEKSGYVSFEQFTRLILAIAPPKVIRADVVNFFDAQSKRNDDLVDYNEFLISGKVLLLTKLQRAQALADRVKLARLPKGAREAFNHRNETSSTAVWLKRQRQFVGQESTYTWKNHLRWYQRRKAQALIWLIRRATRSLKHELVLAEAKAFLLVQAKQAKAMSDLIDIGRASLKTQSLSGLAKRRLLKRSMHARRFMVKVLEAQEFLRGTALTAIKDLDYMDRVMALKEQKEVVRVEEARQALAKKTQANYATLFKIKALQNMAVEHLSKLGRAAKRHCLRQDDALDFLRDFVHRALKQLALKDKARRELLMRAEAAYAFCLAQDQALLRLLRYGEDALRHMDKQEAALKWLLERGQSSVVFLAGKFTAAWELVKIGQHTLKYMNRREDAHIYLNKRRIKSAAFIERKQEAIAFLKECPRNIWAVLDRTMEAQAWLQERAARAQRYAAVRMLAARQLQHIAGKATSTYRRSHIAYQELCQVGMIAKFKTFQIFVQTHPALQRIIKTETQRNRRADSKQIKSRRNWSVEERLKWDMAEVFQLLVSVYTPAHVAVKNPVRKLDAIVSGKESAIEDEHHLMGLYAFRMMMQNGKVFKIPPSEVDETFRNTDVTASCYVEFETLLPWLRRKALRMKNGFQFKVSDVLSAQERAFMTVWLRVQRDKDFIKVATDQNKYEEMKEKLRKNRNQEANEWSDDEDEEEEEEEVEDEDALFADLEKLRNMDVGRLMRYLTKKREAQQQRELIPAVVPSAAVPAPAPDGTTEQSITAGEPAAAAPSDGKSIVEKAQVSNGADPVKQIVDGVLAEEKQIYSTMLPPEQET